MKDCWAWLGVRPGCSEEELRRAFADAARKHHPEEEPELFMQLQNAYREAMRRISKGGRGRRSEGSFRTPGNLDALRAGGKGQRAASRDVEAPEAPCGNGADARRTAGGKENAFRLEKKDAAAYAGGAQERRVGAEGGERGEREEGHGGALRFPVPQESADALAPLTEKEEAGMEEGRDKPLRFPRGAGAGRSAEAEKPGVADEGSHAGAGREGQGGEAGSATVRSPSVPRKPSEEETGRNAGALQHVVFPGEVWEELPDVSTQAGEAQPCAAGCWNPMLYGLEGMRRAMLRRMEAMAKKHADVQAWLELTGSCYFSLFLNDPAFADGLAELCRRRLDNALCAALYAAMGLSSRMAPLRGRPAAKPLVRLLEGYSGLPAADVPHEGQSQMLERCGNVLDRLGRLAAWTEDGGAEKGNYALQQYGQTEEFLRVAYQPLFIMRACAAASASPGMKRAIGCLYASLAGKTPFLPAHIVPRKAAGPAAEAQEPPRQYARFLQEEDKDAFFAGARADLLSLFERTARHFRFSDRRSPWDYVFARPHFAMLRRDDAFLRGLAAFIRGRELPLSFFQAFEAAFAAEAGREKGGGKAAGSDAHDALRELLAAAEEGQRPRQPEGVWKWLARVVKK